MISVGNEKSRGEGRNAVHTYHNGIIGDFNGECVQIINKTRGFRIELCQNGWSRWSKYRHAYDLGTHENLQFT